MMKFGYIPEWSNIPWDHHQDTVESSALAGQVMLWDSTLGKWKISYGAGGGDVKGPSSNTLNTVTLFDGTTGKLLKDDPEFTYNTSTNTMFVQNISKSAVTGTDLAITGVSGGSVNITGYSAASGPGSVTLASGAAPTLGLSGGEFLLETSDTVNGSIKITGGDRNTATYTQQNEVYIRSTSNSDAGYISARAASTDSNTGADVKLYGGSGSSSEDGGSIYIAQTGSNATTTKGATVYLSASVTGTPGTMNIVAGDATTASGGNIDINAGSLGYASGNQAGDIDIIARRSVAGGGSTLAFGGSISMTGANSTDAGSISIKNGYVVSNSATRRSEILLSGPDASVSGAVTINGGTYSTGNGADIELIGGNSTTGATDGGYVIFTSYSPGTVPAGAMNLNTGTGAVNAPNAGPGGDLTLTGGAGGSSSGGVGGAVVLTTGDSTIENSGNIIFQAGDGSGTAGNVTISSGDGTTTGGSLNFVASNGSAFANDGDVKFGIGGNQYFWPRAARAVPGTFTVMGISSISGTNVTMQCLTPDPDLIFKMGTLICRWDNSISLATAGLTSTGSAGVVGTLGTDNDVYLQLTPDSGGQNGKVYIDASGVAGYNTAYRDNWEFRGIYYSNATPGNNQADGTWIWGQGSSAPGSGEFDTTGCSVFMNEYSGGSLLHQLEVHSVRGGDTVYTFSYTGASWGGCQNFVRVRKQGTTLLFEFVGPGYGGFATGYVQREVEVLNPLGDYYGIGARTGGAWAQHLFRYIEFRQLPHFTPIVPKYNYY